MRSHDRRSVYLNPFIENRFLQERRLAAIRAGGRYRVKMPPAEVIAAVSGMFIACLFSDWHQAATHYMWSLTL